MTGNDILALRARYGLTQEQLAQRICVAANTVARWERGEIQITGMVENSISWLEEKLRTERGPRRRYRPRWRKRMETESAAPSPPTEQITLTLSATRLRQLSQLCHPDKHNNSKMATEVTAWLNELRRAIRTV